MQPDGFRYGTFKLEDGVSFVHLASRRATTTRSARWRRSTLPGGHARALRRAAGGHRLQEVGRSASRGRVSGAGRKDDPWQLKTPPLSSEYEMYLDERDGKKVIVCVVGKTTLLYDARAIDDLHAMLTRTATGSSWAAPTSRSRPRRHGRGLGALVRNPVGGWYGLKKGLRGRFGMYMPPLLEELGLAEVEHNPRNNRMRAK